MKESFRQIEEHISQAVDKAKLSDIELDELLDIMKTIYME